MKQKNRLQTIDALLRHLADESEPLSVAKLYALSNLDREDMARVQEVWPQAPDERRRAAMRHLTDITETNFEVNFGSMFRAGLTDPDPGVRQAAIEGLWEEDDPTLIAPLVDLVRNDAEPAVRAASATALGHFVYLDEIEAIPHAKAVPATRALRDVVGSHMEPVEVRRRAVEALGYSSDDDIPGMIRAAHGSPEEEMRISSVYAMGASADEQWIDTVIEELESQIPAMRFEAARAAGELEARNAVPVLARLLDDPDREVQDMAIWALGQIGGDRARALLSELANSDDDAVAEAAADALEELAWMHGGDRDMPLFTFDPTDEDDE